MNKNDQIKFLDGIILSKTPYQDRHLLSRVLLKNGKKISVNFLGGQGGGKKMKSSLIQLGHGVRFSLTGKIKEGEQLNLCKEYKGLWEPKSIRDHYRAFYLMCFFLELIDKISLQDDLRSRGKFGHVDIGDEGLYNVLSNAIFYLDDALINNRFDQKIFLLFLCKVVFQLGLTPNLDREHFSDIPLSQLSEFHLSFENGGFVDSSDAPIHEKNNHKDVWKIMRSSWDLKFKNYSELETVEGTVIEVILNYLLYHLGSSKNDFKTLSMIL